MKKSMISAIIILTIIILMATFGFSLDDRAPIAVAESVADKVLFICPAKSPIWEAMAAGFGAFSKYILIGVLFATIMLIFMWGWGLYQNLLKDAFKKDSFAKPWTFTKMLFWTIIIIMLVINTPNRYRAVNVTGRPGNWVLCENTSDGAVAVPASSVRAK